MSEETFGPWSAKSVPNLWEESKVVNVSQWYNLIARSMGVLKTNEKKTKSSKNQMKDFEKNLTTQSAATNKKINSPRLSCLEIYFENNLFNSVKYDRKPEQEAHVTIDQFLMTPQYLLQPWSDNHQTLEESIMQFTDRTKNPKKGRNINNHKRIKY